MNFNFKEAKCGLIVGGGHGIGLSLCKQLHKQYPNLTLYVTYSNKERAKPLLEYKHEKSIQVSVKVTEESEISGLCDKIKQEQGNHCLDFVINCTGFLHQANFGPEKSLKDINKAQLLEYFEVNSIVTPLLAKYLKPLFKQQSASCFAVLSAKVGSIGDNALGGWYGYRASKSALNMFLKNIAIEFKRHKMGTIVLTIHPGTTQTDLSSPFLEHIQHKVWSPEDTAQHILEVMNDSTIEQSGQFFNWDGKSLPW